MSEDKLQKENRELRNEIARVQARESEAVMQSERDARRADANAAEIGRLRVGIESLAFSSESSSADSEDEHAGCLRDAYVQLRKLLTKGD